MPIPPHRIDDRVVRTSRHSPPGMQRFQFARRTGTIQRVLTESARKPDPTDGGTGGSDGTGTDW